MLSDRLFDVRWKLLEELREQSTGTFGADYPNAQKKNLILALYHMQLAQMAFDSFERPNNHKWSIKEKKLAMDRAVEEYEEAVEQN
tara:strand:+ start:15 stop:272 length:258 start_codon:yes stop_codon:yes gene_type:complete